MAQFVRPISDVTVGSWTTSTFEGTLASHIDEPTPFSTLDYIRSGVGNFSDTCRVNGGSVIDPAQSSGHVLRFMCWRTSGTGGWLEVKIYSGGVLVGTFSTNGLITTNPQTFTFNLSGPQTDAIGNYADIDFEIIKNHNGFNSQMELDGIELEVPDPTQTVTLNGFANTSAYGTPTLTGVYTVAANGFANTSAYGSPSLANQVVPAGFANTSAYGTPTLTPGPVTVTPAGFANASSYGSPQLAEEVTLRGFQNVSQFGSPTLKTPDAKFRALAAGGRGRKILLGEITGPWFVIGQQPGRYASHHFVVRPDDPTGFPNQYYEPRIRSGFSFKRSLVNGNLLRGKSVPDGGTMTLINLDGALTSFGTEALKGYPFTAKIGSDGWYMADFRTIFDGIVEELIPSRDNKTVQVKFASLDRALRNPIQKLRYRGMGQAVLLDGTAGTRLRFPSQAGFVATTKVCLEVYAKLNGVGAEHVFVAHGGHFGGNCSLFQQADGKVCFRVRSSGGVNFTATSNTALPAGWEGRATGRWDGAELQVFIDGAEDGPPTAFAGVIQQSAFDYLVGSSAGHSHLNGWVTDVRVWTDTDRTNEQIALNKHRELLANDIGGLALYAKTNEGIGTKSWDDLHNYEGLLEGAAVFTSTKTGSADLVGKPIPTSWGFVWHRDAVLIDGINWIYQVHHREIYALDGVFEGGRKLAPLYSVAGGWTFESSRRRITASISPPWEFGMPLPIGPFMPFAPGQSITITGGTHAGTYTVEAVDEFGHWLQVAQAVASGTDAAATIATTTGTHEYVGNTLDGTFELMDVPRKTITARLRGDAPGGNFAWTIPGIMKRIATDMASIHPSGISNSFDDPSSVLPEGYTPVAQTFPYEGMYATGLADENMDVIFSKLAISLGANWGYTTDTRQLEIVVMTPPEEDPAPADHLPLSKVELLKINRLRTVPAVRATVSKYRPNFKVLAYDELVGEVQEDQTPTGQAWRQFLTQDWSEARFEPVQELAVVADAPQPVYTDKDEFQSYLLRYEHAYDVASKEHDKYGVEREFFEVEVKLQPYLYDFRRATVDVVHEGWDTTANGKKFRLVNMGGTRTNVTGEIWG